MPGNRPSPGNAAPDPCHEAAHTLRKTLTGIAGFDEITLGGLPTGRPTLICGAAGSGKTLFALTVLVNGATLFNQPGVFMSFEERPAELVENTASLGYDLAGLVASNRLAIDHVMVDRGEIEETGEYDLEGLFVRLGYAVDQIGAKQVVLDTIESLFAGFSNPSILRTELRRLFGWIKQRGLTAIITGESGDGQLTRQGLEEYVSDCVIHLDNRVQDQIATRRLQIVKYRGSAHGTNEYPFIIDVNGISVLPVTSSGVNRPVCNEIISTGIPGLDAMLRNHGFFRGSSILVSGVPGTGKTTIACQFISAACARGERCMLFLFEESAQEVCRNSLSVGIDLKQWVDAGLLRFEEARPSLYGLEMHLARLHRDVDQFKPAVVVIDPISAFRGPSADVHGVLLRMVDLLKARGVTGLFTSLRSTGSMTEDGDQGLSSLMDSWIKLLDIEENGERNKVLYIIKARGSSHSNQVREYHITDQGIELTEAYIGPQGVLTGTARMVLEAREHEAAEIKRRALARRRRELDRRHASIGRQIAELQATLDEEDAEGMAMMLEQAASEAAAGENLGKIAQQRGAAE